jgi:hypothetical protein
MQFAIGFVATTLVRLAGANKPQDPSFTKQPPTISGHITQCLVCCDPSSPACYILLAILQVQQVQQRAIAADGYQLYGLNHPLVSLLIQVRGSALAIALLCNLCNTVMYASLEPDQHAQAEHGYSLTASLGLISVICST